MYRMNVANDLGYSSLKAVVDGQPLKMPSIMAVQRAHDLYDPLEFKQVDDPDQYFADLMNHLDVTIQSPAVKEAGRMLVGQSAVTSGLATETLDVNDLSGKSTADETIILTLSLIAGQAVKDYWTAKHELPVNLDVEVNMTTALPVLEGKRGGTTKAYQARYLNARHTVTLYNFTDLMSVNIQFKNVIVALEGETAQYRIMNPLPAFVSSVDADFKQHYPLLNQGVAPAEQITGKTLTTAGDLLSVDIGEGTVDLVVFNNHKINIHDSTSMPKGYGNALQEAVNELQAEQINVSDRISLQNFLDQTTNALKRRKQQRAQKAVDHQMDQLAGAVVDVVSQTLNKAATGVDVIYVYGGGSVPLEPYLRKPLMEKTRAFNGGDDIPVIFIEPRFAQYMNQAGLQLILDKMPR